VTGLLSLGLTRRDGGVDVSRTVKMGVSGSKLGASSCGRMTESTRVSEIRHVSNQFVIDYTQLQLFFVTLRHLIVGSSLDSSTFQAITLTLT